ncbi:MAG TPA: archease [Methanobacterium sp.]
MNSQKKFEFFDVTADVGILAYGKTIEESFENAALALFEVMTDTSSINPSTTKYIKVESEDLSALLYDWLSELIFLHDSENLIFSRFEIHIAPGKDNYILNGTVKGEAFNRDKHESREDVKAVTYHLMDIKEENGFTLQFILDT